MKQETLKKAIELNEELNVTFEIIEAMKHDKSEPWLFLTPFIREFGNDNGIELTKRIRKKLYEAMGKLNVEIKKEIEAL